VVGGALLKREQRGWPNIIMWRYNNMKQVHNLVSLAYRRRRCSAFSGIPLAQTEKD